MTAILWERMAINNIQKMTHSLFDQNSGFVFEYTPSVEKPNEAYLIISIETDEGKAELYLEGEPATKIFEVIHNEYKKQSEPRKKENKK